MREILTAGQVVKAIILNGLGFVSRPLYLFPQFFEDKATEHLLGKGIEAKYLNDDKIGRVMDDMYGINLSNLFLLIALAARKKYGIAPDFSHLIEVSSDNKNPKKKGNKTSKIYQITGSIKPDEVKIEAAQKRAGRFVLATNRMNRERFTSDDILQKYKEQQAPERGFAFLKDPLFFADIVFLKTPERIETMAMLMGLCLLVYSIGQRQLRLKLFEGQTGLKNQLGKLTKRPTLRWIFQCFQGIDSFGVHQWG